MKNLVAFISLALCSCSASGFAQSKAREVVITEPSKPSAYKNLLYKEPVYNASAIETQPSFPGGMGKFFKYIFHNLKYPAADSSSNISGKVFVEFIVEKDGSLTNAKILRPGWAALDREVLKVIANSPKWKPGLLAGKKVRVRYTMPIHIDPGMDK